MTQPEMLLKYKMNLLQLAEQLQNIRKACKVMGVSRQHYYDIRKRFEQQGEGGLKDKPRPYPNMPNKSSQDLEKLVLDYSMKHPTYGKDRVAMQLRFDGVIVGATRIERIWRRNKLDNRFKRLIWIERLHREQGMVLSPEQIQGLLQYINEVPAEHVFSKYPGYLLCQDTFEVGHLKGVGKVYMQAVIDTYGSFGFAKLYTSKLPITCSDILVSRVLPFYKSFSINIQRIMTDNGGEFCGKGLNHDYELTLSIFNIDHRRIKPGMPQTNGFVERFNRTVLEEFFCVAFRKKWYSSVEELQKDLDIYLQHYNFERAHQGYRLKGKRPIDVMLDHSNYQERLTYDKIETLN
jgi:transposase InsO family protein